MGLPSPVPTLAADGGGNLRCGICGLWQSQVARLFVGGHGCVCDACVEACARILRAERGSLRAMSPTGILSSAGRPANGPGALVDEPRTSEGAPRGLAT